ncbi:MAG TPA: class I SAM-dependent methyltransferase [Candidatus Saccharimonadia bacterium]|nr:class I SAM-dependent methyltransferase [Candidatus Saccharimonadia bacterium]
MKHAASFRDPAGFVFEHRGRLLRQVNAAGVADYDSLMQSGLYEQLTGQHLLIPHREVEIEGLPPDADRRLVIEPDRVRTISYPYEWGFSQLQDAALTTLAVQAEALRHGLTLKDASAYNIQFHEGRPLLIDTLSFEKYTPSSPWAAYRQFCQHFLAPLALMSQVDVDLGKLLLVHLDGVPLPLAAKLLPRRARLSPGLAMHLFLHARAQSRTPQAASAAGPGSHRRLSQSGLEGLVDSLTRTVRGLRWRGGKTEWGDYYNATNYSATAFEHKQAVVASFLDEVRPQTVWDLGANTGQFSRLAGDRGIHTVSFDIDPVAVEANYRLVRDRREPNILPLLLDLTNPSPAIGWANAERSSLAQRGRADLVMALALVHHLAISNNLPLASIAAYFAALGRHLVVEFIPKSDSKVQILLATRPDIFPDYTMAGFERAFAQHFQIVKKLPVKNSERTLYLMENLMEKA